MILDSASRKLQIVLTAAKTTTDMPVSVSYVDITDSGASVRSSLVSTNGVTAVDILGAPSGQASRAVKSITIVNTDTAAKTLSIKLLDGTNAYLTASATLQVGDTLGYTDSNGWYVLDTNGNRKTSSTSSGVLSTSPTTGIGYATGAGGAVTQATSKATGVTLDKISGAVTMHAESLAANTNVAFTLTNAAIAATDVVVACIKSGATAASYAVIVDAVAAGSCRVSLLNVTGGALAEAVVLNFVVIKAVAA